VRSRNDGKDAESRAARYLEKKGYVIVARNWRTKRGELDLVALDGKVLCFVEVRQRGAGALVSALESIDAKKRARVVHAAQQYLHDHQLLRQAARFDVITIEANDALTHIAHAFTAD